ncbi:MAG: hypothetical protein AAGB13_09000 [Cyanobacteria bacterium P01_F01_bin.33]
MPPSPQARTPDLTITPVAAILALASHDASPPSLKEKLTLMSRLAETKWLDAIRPDDLNQMGDIELVSVVKTRTINLSRKNWRAIASELAMKTPAVRGLIPTGEDIEQIAVALEDGFAIAFREVLKEDFAKDGRAFAGFLIDVLTGAEYIYI